MRRAGCFAAICEAQLIEGNDQRLQLARSTGIPKE
jgi:hypothetical protein